MSWARLDDDFPQHPKVIGLSDGAFRLHVTAICYATRNLTDGKITTAIAKFLNGTPKQIAELHNAGVWDADEGGEFIIHDFLKYNKTRSETLAKRQQNATNGAKGGTAKRYNRLRSPEPVPDPDPNKNSSTRARSARQWWEFVTNQDIAKRPDKGVLRQVLDDIQVVHGFDCVGIVFEKSVGKDEPWPYAKAIFDSCVLGGEGHFPRGANGASNKPVRARGAANHRGIEGEAGADW